MTQISSFGGLQTTLRGLLAHQRLLDVTSNNIANASTEGFTRQSAVVSATAGIAVNGASTGGVNWLGQGADVTAYTRVRDSFLDVTARAQAMVLGARTAMAEGTSRADGVTLEPSTEGLSTQLDKLWTSWQTLANAPTDSGARAQLIADAQTVTASLAQLDSSFAQIQTDQSLDYTQLTTDPGNPVDAIAKELALLNDSIGHAVSAGQQPNDQLDRRDLLLDKLSTLGQVSVTQLGYGRIDVQFGDASQPLVSDTTVTWPQSLTSPGGRLGGLLASQTTIAGYRSQLDNVAATLASSVNAIHGTPPFFTGSSAATLTVNVTASTLVAGSGTGAESNDIARAVAALRGGTADRSYQNLVREIGSDASNAASLQTLSTALVTDIDARRTSVAGVSLDEEMMNLVQFQRGYQASARAMSTMDEMLDQLINRTGKVGL